MYKKKNLFDYYFCHSDLSYLRRILVWWYTGTKWRATFTPDAPMYRPFLQDNNQLCI